MLTRKHFVAMAKAVAEIKDPQAKELVYANYLTLCRESNPRFDVSRFRQACGMDNNK